MKNKLEEISAVLNEVMACFPYIFSTTELALLGAQAMANLDTKLYEASLQLINIKAELKTLDQLLDNHLEEVTDEKEVISYFVNNVHNNLDAYSTKLESIAHQTTPMEGNKQRDPKEAMNIICGRIIRDSRLVIANTSDARNLSVRED